MRVLEQTMNCTCTGSNLGVYQRLTAIFIHCHTLIFPELVSLDLGSIV